MSFWAEWWQGLRRGGTHAAQKAALTFGHGLGPAGAMNLRLAGLEPTTVRLDNYFAHFGQWVGWSLAVHEAGFERSGVADLIDLDESVSNLDHAVAAGRGVILAAPHVFCHEICAAAI